MSEGNGRLHRKTAIVTGGAKGMGAATVRRFVEEGANVTLADIDLDAARSLQSELGDAVLVVDLDVSSPDSWERAVDQTVERFGTIDILVNNAGIAEPAPFEQWDIVRLQRALDVNLIGPFNGTQAVVPVMKRAGGGAIVNLGSVGALQGVPMLSGYVASKWALRGLTRTTALELGLYGIRVNAVHPGQIATPMTSGIDFETDQVALGRVGEPEDIASIVLFLSSDDSAFVTGSEIAGDGGQIAGQANYQGVPR